MADNENGSGQKTLESWKEIAAYLQRDVRTARRWELEEGLPVHRHSHKVRGSVYAYPGEIDAWRRSRKMTPEPSRPRPLWKIPAFAATMLLCLIMVGNGIRPQVASAQQATAERQIWSGPGVDDSGSPFSDGKRFVFTDWVTGDLALRDFATGLQRRLTSLPSPYNPGYAERPKVSRDGKLIAFTQVRENGADLRVVGTDGSKERVLFSNPQYNYLEPSGFSPDGKQILAVLNAQNDSDRIALISVADGKARVLKTLAWGSLGSVSLAPDGRYLAYDFQPQTGNGRSNIMILSTDGSREVTVNDGASPQAVFGWSPDGATLLFASERTGTRDLWAIRIVDGKPDGQPERLRSNIGQIRPLGITADGSLYYVNNSATTDVFIASWNWESGKLLAAPKRIGNKLVGVNRNPAWSPDGKYLAYISQSGGRDTEVITIATIDSGEERELKPQLSLIQRLTGWSPDGRKLLLMAYDEKKREGAYAVDVRTGQVQAIAQAASGQTIFRPEWLPRGKAILYYVRDQSSGSRLIVHEVESGAEREVPTGHADAGYIDAAVSPDGMRVAAVAGGILETIALAGGPPRELSRTAAPSERLQLAGWSPDSSQVIFKTSRRIGLRTVEPQLWRTPADGGARQQMALDVDAVPIQLGPDATRIAFQLSGGGASDHGVWALENFLPKSPVSSPPDR